MSTEKAAEEETQVFDLKTCWGRSSALAAVALRLLPYTGEVHPTGRFLASERFSALLAEIREETQLHYDTGL